MRQEGFYWVKLRAPYSEGWFVGEYHRSGYFSFTWDVYNSFDDGDPAILEIKEERLKSPDEI